MKIELVAAQCLVCNEMVPVEEIQKHPHNMAHTSPMVSAPSGTGMKHLEAFNDIANEADSGNEKWGAFNSAHEGFAVLLEEVEELKAHVWTKQHHRDLKAMRKEAMQVAAMALRFMTEVCDEKRGRR
jgi:hypothetical protein